MFDLRQKLSFKNFQFLFGKSDFSKKNIFFE